MPTRDEILDNLSDYSDDELLQFMDNNLITQQDIQSDMDFPYQRRDSLLKAIQDREDKEWNHIKSIGTIDEIDAFLKKYPDTQHISECVQLKDQRLKEAENAKMEQAWQDCDKHNKQDLEKFINTYPNSPHVAKANEIINNPNGGNSADAVLQNIKKNLNDISKGSAAVLKILQAAFTNGDINKENILQWIKTDRNLFDTYVIKALIDGNHINTQDLVGIGIQQDFIDALTATSTTAFSVPNKFNAFTPREHGSTEVYFWGIPSSGKTCALGAILSVAGNGSVASYMQKVLNCQGFDYMTRLSGLFTENKVHILPAGTRHCDIYEMGFDLKDMTGAFHPITCVDLAGELFRSIHTKCEDEEKLEDTDKEMLSILDNILLNAKTGNRKIHFFVVEYGAENRLYRGLPQKDYLDTCVDYIQNRKIFDSDTDGIYIIVTKADKINAIDTGRKEAIRKYLNTADYKAFVNKLKDICHNNEINGGELGIIPFSIGDLCFNNLCKFDPQDATVVVKLLLTDTATDYPKFIYKFKNETVRGLFIKIWKIFKA